MSLQSSGFVTTGQIVIDREIGQGMDTTVYKVFVPRRNQYCALKTASVGSDVPRTGQKFAKEARTLKELKHPNIIECYGLLTDPQTQESFLLCELADRGSLAEHLKQRGPIPEDQAIRLTLDICAALEASSARKVVHRDIKPSNILLFDDGRGGLTAKLGDFGAAQDQQGNLTTVMYTRGGTEFHHPGTPFYMAPEQDKISNALDVRTDLYALGLTLGEMLIGEPYKPIAQSKHRTVRSRNPQASAGIARVIAKATQEDRNLRYQSVAEFVDDLERVRSGRPPVAAAPRRVPRGLGIAAAVAILVLLGGMSVFALSQPSGAPLLAPITAVAAAPPTVDVGPTIAAAAQATANAQQTAQAEMARQTAAAQTATAQAVAAQDATARLQQTAEARAAQQTAEAQAAAEAASQTATAQAARDAAAVQAARDAAAAQAQQAADAAQQAADTARQAAKNARQNPATGTASAAEQAAAAARQAAKAAREKGAADAAATAEQAANEADAAASAARQTIVQREQAAAAARQAADAATQAAQNARQNPREDTASAAEQAAAAAQQAAKAARAKGAADAAATAEQAANKATEAATWARAWIARSIRQVLVQGDLYIEDDETFGSNERQNHAIDDQPPIVVSPDKPTDSGSFERCTGDEVRVVVSYEVHLEADHRTVTVNITVQLYEGKNCRTNNLRAQDTINVRVGEGQTESGVKHVGWSGGDYTDFSYQITNNQN